MFPYKRPLNLDNGCNDHFEPVGTDWCIRFEAFPHDYDNALEHCLSDGADLLFIESQEMSVSAIIESNGLILAKSI